MKKIKSWHRRLKVLKKSEMPIGAYCSPQPAFIKDGIKYGSLINYKCYKLLADLGVNLVYGHNEILGNNIKEDRDVFKALSLCERVGISYLVRMAVSDEYTSLGFKDLPDWRKLSMEDKDSLDKRFIRELRRVKNKKAFAGIIFIDEPGMDSFEGIKAAKDVFDRECPEKLFFVNMFPSEASPLQYKFGFVPETAREEDAPEEVAWNKEDPSDQSERYKYFLEKYMQTVSPDVFSYDSYPFLNFNGSESMVFNSLYFHEQFGAWVEDNYNVPFWPCMQVGGCWENCSAVRITDFADTQLYVNLSLAYGAKGLTLFPACHPNDWIPDPIADVGVIDRNGNPTDRYCFYKYAFKQLKACQKYLLRAKFKCALVGGEFFGLLPEKCTLDKDIRNKVYYGELPAFNNPVKQSFRELKKVEGTSQFFVGCFEFKGKSLFYVVNNSVVTAGNVELIFDKPLIFGLIYKGKESEISGDKIAIRRVGAGEGLLLYVK